MERMRFSGFGINLMFVIVRQNDKMLLVLSVALCVSLTVGRVVENDEFILANGEEEKLVWPDKYTVKAIKMSLTANLEEDFVIWRTSHTSRLDKNKGNVKMFKNIDSKGNFEAFEVHPKTDLYEVVSTVCNSLTAHFKKENKTLLDDILPDPINFKYIKRESMLGYNAVLFEGQNRNVRFAHHKLWTAHDVDKNSTIWKPVRYEIKQYDIKLQYLFEHVIWDFWDLNVEFDEDDVYHVEQFGCSEDSVIKVSPDSEAVTKELMFVDPEKEHHVDHVFNSFKNKFNRKYADEEEHILRKNIFKQNMRLISSTNHKNLGYKLGVNHLADLTLEELEKMRSLRRRPQGKSGNVPFPYTKESLKELVEQLPTAIDLRIAGLVTPVSDQQKCGSCWTYGTTSAVEGALARSNGGRLIRLANQALIDCAWAFGAGGCDGGLYNGAYEWMIYYGLPTEQEYGSYKGADGVCNIMNMTKTYPIKGYTDVTPFSNEALKVAVYNHGPLSVAVEATKQYMLYSSGIYYERGCGSRPLNHLVSLVGYGEQYGELFWILKNSYGVNWGIDGYMLISARVNNDCGVTAKPTYVTL